MVWSRPIQPLNFRAPLILHSGSRWGGWGGGLLDSIPAILGQRYGQGAGDAMQRQQSSSLCVNISETAPRCLICLRPLTLTPSPPPLLISHPTVQGGGVQGRHFCSGNSPACMCLCVDGEVGEKVAIGVSHKIYSLQLCGDLLDCGVH